MADQSQHVVQIPQAVNIAASQDSTVAPQLRQQAIEYLTKVRELSQETWKACLTLYLQGAGSSSTSSLGRDGKEKLSSELRVYCLQIVDDVLGNKPEVVAEEDLIALHQALMSYVQTEFVEGSAEQGVTFIRNKFCYTLTLCFLRLYPSPIPDFLTPFLSFLNLSHSSTSSEKIQPTVLTLRMLCEIAAEVHDPLFKSARAWTAERNNRDGLIRDSLRLRGEVKTIMDGLVGLVESGLKTEGEQPVMREIVEWSLNALATWTPWVDINSSVTPGSLNLYQTLLQHPRARYRNAALTIYSILLNKGTKTAAEKLQIMQVLDVMVFVRPLEEKTRLSGRSQTELSEDELTFRASLGKVLAAYGVESLKMSEDEQADPTLRSQAKEMWESTLALILRFVEDGKDDVSEAIAPLLNDTMRIYKKARKANEAGYVLPQDKSQFFATLLEEFVNQMKWPIDMEWDPADPGDEEDEEFDAFIQRRSRLRSEVDQIAQIDAELARGRIVAYVAEKFNQVQTQGPTAVIWQQVELAVYLTYIYGELQKNSTQGREIFFDMPLELTNALKEKAKERTERYRRLNTTGEDLPGAQIPPPPREHIDFNQITLTPQGEMLEQAIHAGILTYPHSAVTLQYLECVSRYSEFYRCRRQHIQPVLEAFVDQRGIHNEKKAVQQRVIYLFSKFIKDSRRYIDNAFVPAILNGISDALPIVAVLPEAENPGEDLLAKATTGSQAFDTHIYLYESVGALISLIKDAEEQSRMLDAAFQPLILELGAAVQSKTGSNQPELQQVLQVHHVILAIGAIARGFPEPGEVAPVLAPSWLPAFEAPSQAVLQTLEAFKGYRIVRDAARSAIAGVIGTLATRGTHLVPPLVVHTIDLFEPRELLEFLGFLGMLAHRLKDDIKPILEELVPILFDRVYALLSTAATGTDEAILQGNMKKGYLSFLQTIFTDDLQSILISDRNKPRLDGLINHLISVGADSADRSDRSTQKAAFFVLMRSLQSWSFLADSPTAFLTEGALLNKESKKQVKVTGNPTNAASAVGTTQYLPGYEAIIYERIVPAGFQTILDPEFQAKDGQASLVIYEIGNLLRELIAARGLEAVEFLQNTYLPTIGCPPAAIQELILHIRSDTVKDFKKWFGEFMKEWKAGLGLPA